MSDTVVIDRSQISPQKARKAALAGGIGSFIEWYDYGLYGLAAALYITPLFFSGQDPFFGTLLTFATFAVGFAARPLGGFVLGYLGDRWGRKPVLLLSVILMGASTALMGMLPTAESVGVLAPILLVTLRLIQGFGAGAELAGAFVYISESTPPKSRGFFASWPAASIPVGALLASGMFLALEAALPKDAMMAWGWRVPFLLALVGLIVAVVVRTRLDETPEFEEGKKVGKVARLPLLTMFRADPRSFVAGLLAPTIVGVGAYVTTVFGLNYVRNNLEIDPSIALVASLASSAVAIVTVLAFGKLSDRFGSHKVFLFGSLFFLVMSFPFFLLLQTRDAVVIVIAVVLNYSVGWAAVAASQGRFLPSLFSMEHRFSGVAVTREINSAALAGPAPFIAVLLAGALGGQPWLVSVMIAVGALLSVAGVALGWRRASRDAAGLE